MDGENERGKSRRPDKGWKGPLWERQANEPPKAFEAFGVYRDGGPGRSIAATAKALRKSVGTLQPWSTQWGWVERAGAWDDEADRNQRKRDAEERAIARRRMLDDHGRAGRAMVAIGASVLQRYDASDPANAAAARAAIKELSAGEAARLIETGAKMERLARGESTERLEVREALDWVEGFLDLALGYLPRESHDAFLADVDAKLGMGASG